MDIPTIPGAVYSIASSSSCDVTDKASGKPLGTATPGSPVTTPAYSDALTLSDPDALYVQIKTFNFALAALGLLGGGVKYPGFDLKKYAHCVTVADMRAVNPDYKNDLTADGAWIYPLPSLKDGTEVFMNSGLKHIIFNAPNLTYGRRILNDCPQLLTVEAYMPKFKSGAGNWDNGLFMCGSYKVQKAIIHEISEETFTLTYFATGCRSLTEFSIPELPKLSSITNGFSETRLNKVSIIKLLNQLPTWTSGDHLATIGIHVDNRHDEEVLTAITNAEAKGWTLTVQWNGTPTAQSASTFGLRKPPIYAKLGNIERPDGSMEQFLDWGHYVTDWEENGYMEFTSVEDANAYWGIQEELLTAYNENE